MRNIRSKGGRDRSDSTVVISDWDLFSRWIFIFFRACWRIEQWVLPVKLLQFGIQRRMPFLQLTGLLEKTFRGHGEKLRGILGAIGVQDRFPAVFRRAAKLVEFRAQNFGPRLVAVVRFATRLTRSGAERRQ